MHCPWHAVMPPMDPHWRLLHRVAALDSTFIRLSASLSPWSIYGGAPAGARMEILLDRGYYGHPQLARLPAAGVSFVARLIAQARYTILETTPVPAEATPRGDRIVLDARIRLGCANNRTGAVLHNIRLVVSINQDGQELALVTDRQDLPATMIVVLYRKRWQIEVFFRWLKRQLGLIRPLGRTREAVWMTVLVVMIVAVISQLLAPERPPGVSRIAWLHQTALVLSLEFLSDG